MDLKSPKKYKEEYLKLLTEDGSFNNIVEELVDKKEEEPISIFKYLNPEATPNYYDEQRQMSEILLDINAVNSGINELKTKIQDIFTEFDECAKLLNDSLNTEISRIKDVSILCGTNSPYNTVWPVNAENMDETVSTVEIFNNDVFCAHQSEMEKTKYQIVSVIGNGYDGNSFVYKDGAFENETDNYDNLEYILDDNDLTAFEYSRLCTDDKTEIVDGIINYDNKDVEVTITLMAENPASQISILSETEDLLIERIEYGNDGINFSKIEREHIYINDKNKGYEKADYIYGTGIICFPASRYIRLTLSSNAKTTDRIAYQQDEIVIFKPFTRRKKIRINNIKLFSGNYSDGVFISEDLIDDGNVGAVSLFMNQYIPDHFTKDDYIQCSLIVNGKEYNIDPANIPGKNKINIIRYSDKNNSPSTSDNTELIMETIKSLIVKIKIKAFNRSETPYVSNIKLCLGKGKKNEE